MGFLFRLDLSLHAGAGKKFGILNYATKQGPITMNKSKQVRNSYFYVIQTHLL